MRIPFVGSVDSDRELLKSAYVLGCDALRLHLSKYQVDHCFSVLKSSCQHNNPVVLSAVSDMQRIVNSFYGKRVSEYDALLRLREVCGKYNALSEFVVFDAPLNRGVSSSKALGGVINRLNKNLGTKGMRFKGGV